MFAALTTLAMILRLISGAAGLAVLGGTVLFGLHLWSMERDASVFLAAYLGIGFIMLGAYLLFYALSGEWRPQLGSRKRAR